MWLLFFFYFDCFEKRFVASDLFLAKMQIMHAMSENDVSDANCHGQSDVRCRRFVLSRIESLVFF